MSRTSLSTALVLQSNRLLKAEKEWRLPLRLAFLGLLNCCDKNGVFYWRPQQLKAKILPYDEIDFGVVLDVLADYDFIDRHEENGAVYGYVLSQTVLANWT